MKGLREGSTVALLSSVPFFLVTVILLRKVGASGLEAYLGTGRVVSSAHDSLHVAVCQEVQA